MDDDSFWFQDPDAWVKHCAEFYYLANDIALPVMEARVGKDVGDRVVVPEVKLDAPPRELKDRLLTAAKKLHDLADFLEDTAATGFADGEFKPAVPAPVTKQ